MGIKKNRDPYPITDVYHVTSTLVDAATVVVTDLCENLSNSIDTHCDDIIENLKKLTQKNIIPSQSEILQMVFIQYGWVLIKIIKLEKFLQALIVEIMIMIMKKLEN